MKANHYALLLTLLSIGCAQEPSDGASIQDHAAIDWLPSKPMVYSTNVSASSPLVIRYLPDNMPNLPPLVNQDILPRIELKNNPLDKLYSLDAKLTYGEKIWEYYIELDAGVMDPGIHSLMMDSFQRRETIGYPLSVGDNDTPVLIDIRYTTGVGEGTELSGIVVLMRFSEPIRFNTDAVQILNKPAQYKNHTIYINDAMPENIVQMSIYYEPGTVFDGTTLKFSIDGSAIVSPISGKSLIPITESDFDLSDRFVYTDTMQRQGDTMVFEQVLPPLGGGILWGVDLTPGGLRAHAASN